MQETITKEETLATKKATEKDANKMKLIKRSNPLKKLIGYRFAANCRLNVLYQASQ